MNFLNLQKENKIQLPKIFIAVPIRNRAWIIDDYLTAIYNLDYPKNLIHIYFLINDSEDDTYKKILYFKIDHEDEYLEINCENRIYGKPEGHRKGKLLQLLYPHFAMLKNYVKDKFLDSDCNYWFQLDSDTICEYDTLKKLVNHQVGYVCGVCSCDQKAASSSKKIINVMKKIAGKYERVAWEELEEVKKLKKLFECDWIGGIVLMNRFIAKNCNYHTIKIDYDDNLGFCQDVQEFGFKVWVDPEIFLNHYMLEKRYKAKKKEKKIKKKGF